MTNDPYGILASGLPPELAEQYAGQMRKKQIAEALSKQAMTPMEMPTVAGAKVSPLATIAKVFQAYQASKLRGESDKEMAGLSEQSRQMVAKEMAKYESAKTGIPGSPMPPEELGGGPAMPATPGDPRKAILDAMISRHPQVRQMADRDWKVQQEDTQAKRDFENKKWEIGQKAQDRLADIAEKAREGRITKEEADVRARETKIEMAELVKRLGGGGGQPFFTPVVTTEGIHSFDNRKGTMTALPGAGGAPLVKPQDDPNTQAAIAAAKATGKGTGEANELQFQTASSAAENVTKIDKLIGHLKSSEAITGMGAETLKNIERAKVMVSGSIAAGKKVSDTEIADIMMGAEVFPLIKELGVGARGMDTPAEREFMRNVLTGTISLNKDTLVRMAEIRKSIAERSIKRWNDRVDKGELDDYFTFSKRTKGKLGSQPAPSGGVRVVDW